MKRIVLIITGIFFSILLNAQAYQRINVVEPDYVQIKSFQGIAVSSLSYNQAKGYTITLKNNNYNRSGEINSYYFDWYLCYKGKRVSDYFSSTINCRREETRTNIYTWPSSVPSGHEKYVTVQFGKEKPKKDRRDDD